MRDIAATFFDGKSSRPSKVRLAFDATGNVRVEGCGRELVYTLTELRISDRLANTPRSIYLPDGAKCETRDNDLIDEVLRLHRRQTSGRLLHRLESGLPYAALAVLLSVVTIWAGVQFGIPWLAKRVAYALPQEFHAELGADVLEALDRWVFQPSGLGERERMRLKSHFETMTRELAGGRSYQLQFRRSEKLGANAVALPSGIILLTDDLVRIAKHDNELVAVMAHEIGHVEHRHALRQALQNSAVALVVASITGDVASLSGLAAALPTLLVEARYSRDFETEADQYALTYLQDHDIPATHFTNILERLETASGGSKRRLSYLSTHPSTAERIRELSVQSVGVP
jgi:Zn-dependent protease with chaperone function